MQFELKRKEASIVLIGAFNPSTFHPGWFTSNGLVRPDDLKDCRIEILHSDLAIFWFEWVHFLVDRHRFQAKVREEAYYEQLRDLMVGTLSLLQEAKISAVGLNYEMHFEATSEQAYHAFGDMVAPKGIWKQLRDGSYGLSRMDMQCKRDKPPGFIQTIIMPSAEFKAPTRGLYFENNNHYENTQKEIESVISIIQDHWESECKGSFEFIENLLRLVNVP